MINESPPKKNEPDQQRPPVIRCARCGVTSTLPEVFQRGAVSQQRSGLLCPRCLQERQAFYANRFSEAMCFLALLGALLWWGRGMAQLGLTFISIAGGYFFTIILTPLHELAHALTALALGLPVYSIRIGWFGKPFFKFNVGRCLIEVTRTPIGGMTVLAHPSPHFIRIKEFAVIAAGPLLHCVLLYFTWLVIDSNESSQWMPGWAVWIVIVFGLANVFEIVLNLWPRRLWSTIGNLANDGLLLLRLPFAPQTEIDRLHFAYYQFEYLAKLRKGDYAGAAESCRQGLDRCPYDITLKYCQAIILLEQGMFDDARRVFEELRQFPVATGEWNALLLNNIAWADLVSWNQDLGRADDYSRQAIEALPWRPEVKGTRGGVLIVSGEIESGMNLVRQAFAENEEIRNKASNAAFLALGSARLGKDAEARDLLRRAKRLDPHCRVLEHMRHEIDRLAMTSHATQSEPGSAVALKE